MCYCDRLSTSLIVPSAWSTARSHRVRSPQPQTTASSNHLPQDYCVDRLRRQPLHLHLSMHRKPNKNMLRELLTFVDTSDVAEGGAQPGIQQFSHFRNLVCRAACQPPVHSRQAGAQREVVQIDDAFGRRVDRIPSHGQKTEILLSTLQTSQNQTTKGRRRKTNNREGVEL